MSAMDAVVRMLTLVPWVQERPGVTLDEIAEAFDTDVATIEANLEALNYCGLPGGGGGELFEVTTIADEVHITMADELQRTMRPTRAEALRLVLTVDAVAEVLSEEVPALHSAVEKVRAALDLPEHMVDVLSPGSPQSLPKLRQAVAEQRQLQLQYVGRSGQTTVRRVDPWALQVVDGTWYLQGHDHTRDAERTFRVDRIANIERTDTEVRRPRPVKLEMPQYVPNEADVTVELALDADARWVERAVMVDAVEEEPDGSARIRFRTDVFAWVAELVLMAGGGARVIAPADLVDMVRARAQAALANYA